MQSVSSARRWVTTAVMAEALGVSTSTLTRVRLDPEGPLQRDRHYRRKSPLSPHLVWDLDRTTVAWEQRCRKEVA